MELNRIQSHVYRRMLAAEKPICWMGSVRAGKTTGALYALLSEAIKVKSTYIAVAYTFNNHDRTIIPKIEPMLESMGQEGYKLVKKYPYKLTLANGSDVFFVSAPDESSFKTIQGMTIRGAIVDECLLIPKSFIMQLVARQSEPDPFLLMTANKSAPNNWLKREWIDTEKAELIESGLDGNPHIGQKTRAWYDNLITGHSRKNMIDNEWAALGQHICKSVQFVSEGELNEAIMRCERIVMSTYEDPAFVDGSRQVVLFAGRRQAENGMDIYLSRKASMFRPVQRVTNRDQANITFNPKYAVLADAMGAYSKIHTDDEELAGDLSSLVWVDRGKPCYFPANCVSAGMACNSLRNIMTPIDKPSGF